MSTDSIHDWSQAAIQDVRKRCERALIAEFGSLDATELGVQIHSRIKAEALLGDKNFQEVFVLAMIFVNWQIRTQLCDESECKSVLTAVEKMLGLSRRFSNPSDFRVIDSMFASGSSQLALQFGRTWEATWQQRTAQLLADGTYEELHRFGAGIRNLRLGFVDAALVDFCAVEEKLPDAKRVQSKLFRLKAYRLSGNEVEFSKLFKELSIGLPSEEFELEREWEAICRKLQSHHKFGAMADAVIAKGTHSSNVYIAEAFVWARACKAANAPEKMQSLKYLRDKKLIRREGLGQFYEFILRLNDCYDEDFTVSERLQRLGIAITHRNEIPGIDRELLVLSAAMRWLSRAELDAHYELVAREYHELSARVTSGRSKDALNFF